MVVAVERPTERLVSEMDRSAQIGAIVAAPVQDEVGVDHAVAGFELDRYASGKGLARVLRQLAVLRFGVRPAMTARDNPQDVVVVERDVPLNIAGTISLHV